MGISVASRKGLKGHLAWQTASVRRLDHWEKFQMSFCGACGKRLNTRSIFCGSCGRAVAKSSSNVIPDQARPENHPSSDAQPPSTLYAVHNTLPPVSSFGTPPPPRPSGSGLPAEADKSKSSNTSSHDEPQKKGSGTRVGVIAMAVVLAAGITFLFLYLRVPDPEASLDGARKAFAEQDQRSFDKYVDVEAVLRDGIDQFTDYYDSQHNLSHPILFKAGVVAVEERFLPQLSHSVDEFVVSGTMPGLPQWATDNTAVRSALSAASRTLQQVIRSQLTYQGVVSKRISGSDAFLAVQIRSAVSADPITVKLHMHFVHDHWQIVAIDDIPSLLRHMGVSI